MPEWIGTCIKGRDPQFAEDGPEDSYLDDDLLAWLDEIAATETLECQR